MGILSPVPRLDDLRVQLLCSCYCPLEIVQLEPEEDAIPIRAKAGVTQQAMLMFDMPVVQLKHQPSIQFQPFVLPAAAVVREGPEAFVFE